MNSQLLTQLKPNKLVKVCCITSLEEAELALSRGANLLGLVSEMPSGPGVITTSNIAAIVFRLPENIRTVLLTSKVMAQSIVEQHKQVKTWGIQLVDKLAQNELSILKKKLPETCLIGVVHVRDASSISEALGYADTVDMLILDSGNPEAEKRTLGGTGQTHDWEISREICRRSSIPVLLAGGLTPGNISNAVNSVSPAGVDVCSGVRNKGLLDGSLLRQFMENMGWSN